MDLDGVERALAQFGVPTERTRALRLAARDQVAAMRAEQLTARLEALRAGLGAALGTGRPTLAVPLVQRSVHPAAAGVRPPSTPPPPRVARPSEVPSASVEEHTQPPLEAQRTSVAPASSPLAEARTSVTPPPESLRTPAGDPVDRRLSLFDSGSLPIEGSTPLDVDGLGSSGPRGLELELDGDLSVAGEATPAVTRVSAPPAARPSVRPVLTEAELDAELAAMLAEPPVEEVPAPAPPPLVTAPSEAGAVLADLLSHDRPDGFELDTDSFGDDAIDVDVADVEESDEDESFDARSDATTVSQPPPLPARGGFLGRLLEGHDPNHGEPE